MEGREVDAAEPLRSPGLVPLSLVLKHWRDQLFKNKTSTTIR